VQREAARRAEPFEHLVVQPRDLAHLVEQPAGEVGSGAGQGVPQQRRHHPQQRDCPWLRRQWHHRHLVAGAVELIAERPLTGHGPGIYWALGVTYDDHKGEEHQLNAHNTLFHAAAENGLVGAGALAAFLVLALRGAVRSARAARHVIGRAVAVGALAGIVASIVAGLTAVSTDAEPGMLFYALAAIGVARNVMSVPADEADMRDGGDR